MRFKAFTVSAVAVVLFASGCAGQKDVVEQKSAEAGDNTSTSGSSPTSEPAKAAGSLVESGFGQKDEYAWVTSLVHNNSATVGQTVTVQFNAMDKTGALVKSESQVESLSRVGQDLAVGTQMAVPKGTKVAKIEATLLIEDSGTFSGEPSPEMKTTPVKVVAGQYGGFTANFELINPTSAPVKDVRLGIICYDAAKKITGGGVNFPTLVPPSGKIAVETDILTTGKPASCEVFTGTLGM